MFSGIHPIDDPGLFTFFSASPSLSTILTPGNGYYYRPLIELTFYLDNRLWGMDPAAMHLENILLHCANSLLVYVLAQKTSCDSENKLVPVIAALIFALHPVNVEAVAWIAGRTDPLLTLFVLSASYYWMSWLEKPKWQKITFAILLSCSALLTKETAFAFSAVVILLVINWPGTATRRQRLRTVIFMCGFCALFVMAALFYRSGTSGLSRFMAGTNLQVAQGISDALIAFGFYAWKLFFPFPLNFAITAVSPLYGLLVIVLLPLLWWLFRRFRPSGVFFISAALLTLPAILVSVNQVAWTPFAERYLYLPSAFFALGLVGVCELWSKRNSIILLACSALLICGFAFGSFQRNLLWKNSLGFFQDAVDKSREFGSVYHCLGTILMRHGEIDRATEAFVAAERLNKRTSMHYPIKSSIMGTKLAKGEYLEVRSYFFQLFKKKQDASVEFLELLYTADGKRLDSLASGGKVPLAIDLLETLDLLNQKKPDPFWFYRSGQVALVAGNRNDAAGFFRRAYVEAAADTHYKAAAKVYYLRLEAGK